MYLYDCNFIMRTVMKKISDDDMIRDFTESATDFKNRLINPGFTNSVKMAMTTMDINYQLSPPSNQRVNSL